MALLPDTSTSDLGTVETTATIQPNATYKMLYDDDRVYGTVESDLEAVRQACYKILNTERYTYAIYSWNYGVELAELMGKPIPYCLAEIPRRIKEALTWDDRVDDVTDFDLSYTKSTGSVLAKFTVKTIYGDLAMESEVDT